MQISDEAIVLSTLKYSENSAIVSLFTRQHGRFKGMVKGITSKKQRGIYQQGNIIDTIWSARLPEHLGYFNSELNQSVASHFLSDMTALTGLSCLCTLLDTCLAEREPYEHLYEATLHVIEQMIYQEHWEKAYILFELELLSDLGFRLELDHCGATQSTEELIYVSPKTGRAICKSAGAPYHEKLLALPAFINQPAFTPTPQDIMQGITLTGYFIQKYFFEAHDVSMPNVRHRLCGLLGSKTNVLGH